MPLYSFSSYFVSLCVAWEANVKCSSVGDAKVAPQVCLVWLCVWLSHASL